MSSRSRAGDDSVPHSKSTQNRSATLRSYLGAMYHLGGRTAELDRSSLAPCGSAALPCCSDRCAASEEWPQGQRSAALANQAFEGLTHRLPQLWRQQVACRAMIISLASIAVSFRSPLRPRTSFSCCQWQPTWPLACSPFLPCFPVPQEEVPSAAAFFFQHTSPWLLPDQ